MKPNLRVVVLGLGLATLTLCVGCAEQPAIGEEISVSTPPSPLLAAANIPAADAKAADSKTTDQKPTPPLSVPKTEEVVAPLKAPSPESVAADTNELEAAVAPEALPPNPNPALAEVIKLVQAGVGEEVLMTFITNSTEVFNIGSSEILYLHDLGAPSAVITTLIHHDTVRKQIAATAKPLPPGVALTKPATNIFTPRAPRQPGSTSLEGGGTPGEMAVVTNAPLVPMEPESNHVTAPVEEPADISHFYTELAPYGSWVDLPDHGRCWRPTVAVWNSSWRPYADGGRWLWTDSGWYWYSDYSWGWAPFHYGRWTCPSGVGWVWVPDVHWGPAWVSWRNTSSHCGWAPLPPHARFIAGSGFYHNTLSVSVDFDFGLSDHHYVFIPTTRFCDRQPVNHCLRPSHARTVYRESTVVNNYVTVRNTVVNKGVGFERISNATRGNVRQVALKGTSDIRRTTPRREVLETDGRTLIVTRPPAASAPAIKPPARPISALSHLRPRNERGPVNSGSIPNPPPPANGSISTRPERPALGGPVPRQENGVGIRKDGNVGIRTESVASERARPVLTSRNVTRAGIENSVNRSTSTPMAPAVANRGPFPVTVIAPASRPEAPRVAGPPPVPAERSRPTGIRSSAQSSVSTPETAVSPRTSRPDFTRPDFARPSPRSDSRPSHAEPPASRPTMARSPEVSHPRINVPAPQSPSAPPPSARAPSIPAPSSSRSEAYRSQSAPPAPAAPTQPPPTRSSDGGANSRSGSRGDEGGRRGSR